jgi:hypothetical protein
MKVKFHNDPIDIESIQTEAEMTEAWVKLFESNNRYATINFDYCPPRNMERHDVYAYEHGGIKLSLTPFACQWDAGVAGHIYLPQQITGEAKVERLNGLISLLNAYLNNDNYYLFDDEAGNYFEGSMSECIAWAEKNNLEYEFVY